jgi:glucose-1-phosphate thymidylyltransferase
VAENVEIRNSVVGPYVSVGAGCRISDSVISNSIIQSNTKISNLVIDNSMIGNHVEFSESKKELSLGDYSVQVN